MKNLILLATIVLVLFVFSQSQNSQEYRPGDLRYQGIKYFLGELDSCPAIQQGTAHYFGSSSGLEFSGNVYNKKTGCGHVFRPFKDMGVASWFYPCGTKLLVTNLANGKSVIATVMDRGPDRIKYPNVKIDLYKRVFNKLGGTGGRMEVSVVPISGCAPRKVLVSEIKNIMSKIDSFFGNNTPLEKLSNLLQTEAGKRVDVLGEKCLSFLAISSQNPDLICSADCDMTWRSISNPGECYNE